MNVDKLLVQIEIPAGSQIKYELDEETGRIMVDRFMPTTMGYPENYGLIPDTKGKDGDALDILVFASHPVAPGTFMKVRVIGMLEMEDEEGIDHKLLAVPTAKADMICGSWDTLEDIPEVRRLRLKHFFEHYKELEPGKWVKINNFLGREEALKLLEESRE